jgi:RimJ/RimL family protein N-acetyltransferase
VVTPRLRLEVLDADAVLALADGRSLSQLGHDDPYAVLDSSAHVVRLRAAQLRENPEHAVWLLRLVVERSSGTAIGYVNFHAPPDADGMVEIGYQIVPAARRRGYATEAAHAMWAWAARHGARVLRASVAPHNEPSLALVARAGFVQVGEEVDEVDGLELVYERPAAGMA